MRSIFSFALIATTVLIPARATAQDTAFDHDAHSGSNNAAAPVVVSDKVRETLPNDYLRITFVPAGVSVTTIAKPGALRGFATATPLYSPPLKLSVFPTYSGLINVDDEVLVALRCHPRHAANIAALDAVLATWPNVFSAIQRDVNLNPSDCAAMPTDPQTQTACFANAFTDPPVAAVQNALAHTFTYAATLYDSSHTALAAWLQSNYGIYPAFAGTGYSVKDSYYLSATSPMTSQQILVKSISSEYVLKNVTLAEGSCSCISVAPYQGRSNDRLDPEFIEFAGGYGVCMPVNKLEVVHDAR